MSPVGDFNRPSEYPPFGGFLLAARRAVRELIRHFPISEQIDSGEVGALPGKRAGRRDVWQGSQPDAQERVSGGPWSADATDLLRMG